MLFVARSLVDSRWITHLLMSSYVSVLILMKFKKKKYRESIKPKLYDGLHPGGLNDENSVCFPNCVISLKKINYKITLF